MSKKIQTVERVVNYYELDFKFINDEDFQSFFKTLTSLAKTKAKIRYQRFGDKYVFIQGINNKNGLLKAKMRCIRMDLLPELMNMSTDETIEIDAKEQEGVVETTHFIIDYRKEKIILSLEYNHYGSKITDLVNYIQRIGVHKDILENVGFSPIVKDELKKIKERVNRFSEFIVKVHKDNVDKIKKMDNKLWQVLDASRDNFDSDYATLKLKFDFRQRQETSKIRGTAFNIIDYLSKNNKDKYLFNQLKMRAEDEKENDRLATFDLLLEKINSKFRVQKKSKSRTLISDDMFDKMVEELNDLKYR